MIDSDDCRYAIPHELSGIGTVCGLFCNNCNGYGKRCLGYEPHDDVSRKALEDAIREKREKKGKRK